MSDEQVEFLLGSLRDLEAERAAGDIDEQDYSTLKDDYTVRAAAALRASADAPLPTASPSAGASSGRRPAWRDGGVCRRRRHRAGPAGGAPRS